MLALNFGTHTNIPAFKTHGCTTEGDWEERISSKLISIYLLAFVLDCSSKKLQWFYFPIKIQGMYQIRRNASKPLLKSLMKNIQIY